MNTPVRMLMLFAILCVGLSCQPVCLSAEPLRPAPVPPATAVTRLSPGKIVEAAREQIGKTTSYDPAYRKLAYPGGDVPLSTGVCADVVVRALRAQGIDLQRDVHEDMKKRFREYPQKWGLKQPDGNIDHRRVPNLMCYFKLRGFEAAASAGPRDFAAGDIVAWQLPRGLTHIGIVSSKVAANKTPLIIHNIGAGVKEEDILFSYKVIGHYRLR